MRVLILLSTVHENIQGKSRHRHRVSKFGGDSTAGNGCERRWWNNTTCLFRRLCLCLCLCPCWYLCLCLCRCLCLCLCLHFLCTLLKTSCVPRARRMLHPLCRLCQAPSPHKLFLALPVPPKAYPHVKRHGCDSTTQHNTTQRNATQHSTTQLNTTQQNTTQREARQGKAAQRNATQHNAT